MLLALGAAAVGRAARTIGTGGLVAGRPARGAVGLALAFVLQALMAGAEFAGHLSSYQIGFSYGATIDPRAASRSTVLVSLYGMLATLVFLGVNGHHALLRALAASYAACRIGAGARGRRRWSTPVRDILAMVFVVGAPPGRTRAHRPANRRSWRSA